MSQASFTGLVPSTLGNLSNLEYLDLGKYPSTKLLWVSDLNWLSSLSSLHAFGLRGIDLSKAINSWLQVVDMLPTLWSLQLLDCQLHNSPQSHPFVNSTSLFILDLSYNNFNSPIPEYLFNISTLSLLRLKKCELSGSISKVPWGNLPDLFLLDLSSNKLSGNVHDSLGYLGNLRSLNLRDNSIVGPLPRKFVTVGRSRPTFEHDGWDYS
ncbi:hypothetical protein ACOSQ2_018980 [Xanthoceras sorbifolium]